MCFSIVIEQQWIRGGCRFQILGWWSEYPAFIIIWVIWSPKIALVLKSVPKTLPYGEFEDSKIVKEMKFSKYS